MSTLFNIKYKHLPTVYLAKLINIFKFFHNSFIEFDEFIELDS